VAIPLGILIGTQLLMSRWTTFDRLGPWAKLTVGGIVGGVVFTPVALGLDLLFGLEPWAALQSEGRLAAMLAEEAAAVVPPVVLVWLGLNAPRVLGLDFSRPTRGGVAADRPDPDADGSGPRGDDTPHGGLLDRLPVSIGRDIVYLMAELHYVRVVTTRGRSLVLYNLRDAITEMPTDVGIQTHRSYWVAFAHVVRLVNRGGRSFCLMDDGTEVAVSRRESSRVRAQLKRREISGQDKATG
jgi:hypothetical protein